MENYFLAVIPEYDQNQKRTALCEEKEKVQRFSVNFFRSLLCLCCCRRKVSNKKSSLSLKEENLFRFYHSNDSTPNQSF